MIQIPVAEKKEFKSIAPDKGQFIIEPLYPGYGLTVGNALRRVLLSSLEGAAITAMRLANVQHEFSTLEGVREDVVDIILNLKQVRIKAENELQEPIKLELHAKGKKEVRAGDFEKTSGIKVVNPDLIIATLTDAKAQFDLEVWVENDRGYLPTEMMKTKEKEIGVIAIDAFFSPVKRVSIDTENVRVGEMTNWDRLVLDLETDGTLSCEEVLKKAAQILVEQFLFLAEDKPVQKEKEEKLAAEEVLAETVGTATNETAMPGEETTEEKPKRKRGRPRKTE